MLPYKTTFTVQFTLDMDARNKKNLSLSNQRRQHGQQKQSQQNEEVIMTLYGLDKTHA